jgi:hypothetical protein
MTQATCNWGGCEMLAVNADGTCTKHGMSDDEQAGIRQMVEQTISMDNLRRLAHKIVRQEQRRIERRVEKRTRSRRRMAQASKRRNR